MEIETVPLNETAREVTMIEDSLKSMIGVAFDSWKPEFGVDLNELNEIAERLGSELPEALKDLYLVAGNHRGIMDTEYHFVPPVELQNVDGHIVICIENQGLASWAVKADEFSTENPQVLGKRTTDVKWYGEALRLSAFLLHTACWQAIMSMPEVARCRVPKRELKKVEDIFEYIGEKKIRAGYRRQSFIDTAKKLLATHIAMPEDLYIGAKTEGDLNNFERITGFQLDWL
jgi:hypothetical protein